MAPGAHGGAVPKLLILSEAYSWHGAALRASLRAEYGVRDLRGESLTALADMVGWLPAGCALWRSVGGPLSLSEESHELRIIEYRLRVLSWQQSKDASTGRNRPKPPTAPKYARELAAEDDAMDRKAAAYRKRQNL